MDAVVSRPMWEAVERFHGLTYTAPEVRDMGVAAGLKGFWMNYFATRIAPVGAVSAEVVQSTFFYYGPKRVHRAIPDAWVFSTPEAVIAARYEGMAQALHRTFALGDNPQVAVLVAEAEELVRAAVGGCEPIGRLLYAGWASLAWPDDPLLGLWHGCTLLREYRSGNHLIAVCANGLDGIESVITHVAVGGAPRAWIQDEAGWEPADEQAAVERLQSRGLLGESGQATDACRSVRLSVEQLTDELDLPVWQVLGEVKARRLFDVLSQLDAVLPPDDQLDWQQIYTDH